MENNIKKRLIESNLEIMRQCMWDICQKYEIDQWTDNDILNFKLAIQNIALVLKEA